MAECRFQSPCGAWVMKTMDMLAKKGHPCADQPFKANDALDDSPESKTPVTVGMDESIRVGHLAQTCWAIQDVGRW